MYCAPSCLIWFCIQGPSCLIWCPLSLQSCIQCESGPETGFQFPLKRQSRHNSFAHSVTILLFQYVLFSYSGSVKWPQTSSKAQLEVGLEEKCVEGGQFTLPCTRDQAGQPLLFLLHNSSWRPASCQTAGALPVSCSVIQKVFHKSYSRLFRDHTGFLPGRGVVSNLEMCGVYDTQHTFQFLLHRLPAGQSLSCFRILADLEFVCIHTHLPIYILIY